MTSLLPDDPGVRVPIKSDDFDRIDAFVCGTIFGITVFAAFIFWALS